MNEGQKSEVSKSSEQRKDTQEVFRRVGESSLEEPL